MTAEVTGETAPYTDAHGASEVRMTGTAVSRMGFEGPAGAVRVHQNQNLHRTDACLDLA